MVADWLFEDNLRPFVELLAQLAGYTLYDEDYDWLAIEYGMQDTNEDADKWYTYPFAGADPAVFELARNPGSDVVSIRVRGEQGIRPELAAQLDVLFAVCQDYTLLPRIAKPAR